MHTVQLHTWIAFTSSKQVATANSETAFVMTPVQAHRHSTLHTFHFSNNSPVHKVHRVIILNNRVTFRIKSLHNCSQQLVSVENKTNKQTKNPLTSSKPTNGGSCDMCLFTSGPEVLGSLAKGIRDLRISCKALWYGFFGLLQRPCCLGSSGSIFPAPPISTLGGSEGLDKLRRLFRISCSICWLLPL